jgi:biotin carboxylase
MSDRPHVLVLCTPNQTRLAHFRKLNDLRQKYEITVAFTGSGLGWESKFVDRLIRVPENRAMEPFTFIVEAIEKLPKIQAIVNLSEVYLPLHAELCEYLQLKGPNQEVVRVGRNKYHMRKFCQDLGIPVPRFMWVTKENLAECQTLSFPVVIKPAIGCSSTLVKRIDSFAELVEEFQAMKAMATAVYQKELLLKDTQKEFGDFTFVVEELVGGEMQFPYLFPYQTGEISVESIAFNGQTRVLAIHDSPLATNGPYYEKLMNSTPTRIPQKLVEKATDYVSRIHSKLGEGAYVLHTELRTFADDLVLIEFGARIGGGTLYKSVLHSTGNDFIEILVELALGKTPILSSQPPMPTITHYLWAPKTGVVRSIKGESKLTSSPYYLEHQLYDDVGDVVKRAPLSTRASGHIVMRGNCYETLEREILETLQIFYIDVESISE